MSGLFVRFHIGDEQYALPVEEVLEVTTLSKPTPLPGAPAALIGLQNNRGRALPVYDLGSVLGARGSGAPTCLVVASHGAMCAGLAVDGVSEVGYLPDREPTEAPLLTGTVLAERSLVGVVDIAAVLAELEAQVPR